MAVDTFSWGLQTRKRSGQGNPYALSNRVAKPTANAIILDHAFVRNCE